VLSCPKDCPSSSPSSEDRAPEGAASSRAPSKWSRLKHGRHLEVDAEIVRGIRLQASLRGLGSLWRQSPVDLPEEDRLGLYERSAPSAGFDVFLSHTWQTPGRWKVLSLLMQAGRDYALAGWAIATGTAFVLSWLDVLPMPWRSTSHFPQFEHLEVPIFPWCLLGSFVGTFAGFCLTPYAPNVCGQHPVCFLDVVSIHQVDQELMERGIYGLGGFLQVSKELRVLWSDPYLSRLWCVFELAAYRTANPSGRIVLAPLFVEAGIFLTVFGVYIPTSLFNLAKTLPFLVENWFLTYILAMLPVCVLIHLLRRNVSKKFKLLSDLKSFDLDRASCRTDFDREFIHSAIEEWYGSKEAFTAHVRGPLREELLYCNKTWFPESYLLFVMVVAFSSGLDSMTSEWRGGVPIYWIVCEFLGSCVAFHLFWFGLSLKLMIYLCERYSAPIFSGWLDYGQSLVLYAAFFAVYMVGAIVSRLAWRHSLELCLAWGVVSVLVTGFFFLGGAERCWAWRERRRQRV